MEHRLVWIFTLGQPSPELTRQLWAYTMDGALDWIVVPIPERPGQDTLDYLPEERASLIGVR